MTLGQLAKLVRSKNAGPFWITFDIMFSTDADFERARAAQCLTPERIAHIYDVPLEDVVFVTHPNARAIKFSFPRKSVQGDPGESDMYSGQQYAPLLDLPV